jgi:hypothetical protein
MKSYLWQNRILLKDFGKHVEQTSQNLKAASLTAAQQAGRPVQYLPSSQVSKEEIARGIAVKDQVKQGTVCVLTSVEPCWSFEVGPNRETMKLELTGKPRKCLFLYHYRLGGNSIKLYDEAYTEQAAVLRPEVTINDPAQFKVYRPKEGDPNGELAWRQMRRGIADLHRRAGVSQKALDRYCDALASVDDSTTLEELTARLERRTKWNGTWARALHPFDPGDCALLEAIHRGEFTINGLRNRDMQRLLYSTPANSKPETRRRSAAVSRKLRLLRAHGLIQKLPHTHRYQVTENGRFILNAVLSARHATVNQLIAKAA